MDPMELVSFGRNSELTIDATINRLAGDAADLTSLTGDDIRWAISKSRKGPRLATLSLTSNAYGVITKVAATSGQIRIQFRATVPPDDPDPFKPGYYWHECEVVLSEALSTQFWGRVLILPSMFAEAT